VTAAATSGPTDSERPVVDPAADPSAALELRLGHRFVDRELLACALSHRSYCSEQGGIESNERLEFLGDAVLGLVVTDVVYRRFPGLPEGELAKLRSSVVNTTALAEVAAGIGLGSALRLGKGEESTGGRAKTSILADAMEAVIAAVYLDGGMPAAERLLERLLADRVRDRAVGPGGDDFKTRLQELAARRFHRPPRYVVRSEGPDHAKTFFAEVRLDGTALGTGEGRSKKHAEQAAARAAWSRLVERPEVGGAGDTPEPGGTRAAPVAEPGTTTGAVPAATTADAAGSEEEG